ncbi:hypothetical protein BGZ97_000933 [Linnemannia gamsii]|uniref:Uncharacterized protein n=1 Tax=Linnemannia gamsii TaxID=64522 RepID=A0A9P6UJR9_9FUNG|nr:hypothetical protein BGZ97_000933 [Linnemannia gamsii]
MMDWDSFLGSSEATVQDSAPYKPPSMASFKFSTLSDPEPELATRDDLLPPEPYQLPQQGRHQFAEAPSSSQAADAYQAHLSQPMNLTPANHAAFLEYLKSTAYATQQYSTSVSASTTTATTTTSSSAPLSSSTANATPVSAMTATTRPAPPQFQHQSYQPYQPYQPSASTTAQPLFSSDIQHQQHHDGGDVLAFLNSTSYSEYVHELDSAGVMIEKHQQERREFVYTYTEADLGRRSLFSTLQMIQHLPSERQDCPVPIAAGILCGRCVGETIFAGCKGRGRGQFKCYFGGAR